MSASLQSDVEERRWLRAAVQVLVHAGHPMHYTDIKRSILETGLVPAGLKTTLEAALCKEAQSANKMLQLVDGQPGVFALVVREQRTATARTMLPVTAKVRPTHSRGRPSDAAKYREKYRKLKRLVKEMIFVNAAYCDEVIRIEEKVVRAKEERRYLLRRLLQHQATDTTRQPTVATVHSVAHGIMHTSTASSLPAARSSSQSIAQLLGEVDKRRKKASYKKKPSAADAVLKTEDSSASVVRSSKKVRLAGQSNRRRVTPIPLDNSGRPIFPIELGSLTVYCLGEIVPLPGYYTTEHIYPVGFCSTRLYLSISGSSQTCLYTCKVSDSGIAAKFEISPEDAGEKTFTGTTPSDCHRQLLEAINNSHGASTVPMAVDAGAEFFGLSHPTVQNLIQSCAGARKCANYRWTRFEVSRNDSEVYTEDDASVNVSLLESSRMVATTTVSQPLLSP